MDEFRDPEELIALAREAGYTDTEIIRRICRASTLDSVKSYARKYARLLDVSESDFVRIARGRQPKPRRGSEG